MSLRKWWAKRRAVAHFAYIRTLWIDQLRREIREQGLGITGDLKVYCGFCQRTECGCDHARNDKLKEVRAQLRRIHEMYHTDCKNTLSVIEYLEDPVG